MTIAPRIKRQRVVAVDGAELLLTWSWRFSGGRIASMTAVLRPGTAGLPIKPRLAGHHGLTDDERAEFFERRRQGLSQLARIVDALAEAAP